MFSSKKMEFAFYCIFHLEFHHKPNPTHHPSSLSPIHKSFFPPATEKDTKVKQEKKTAIF